MVAFYLDDILFALEKDSLFTPQKWQKRKKIFFFSVLFYVPLPTVAIEKSDWIFFSSFEFFFSFSALCAIYSRFWERFSHDRCVFLTNGREMFSCGSQIPDHFMCMDDESVWMYWWDSHGNVLVERIDWSNRISRRFWTKCFFFWCSDEAVDVILIKHVLGEWKLVELAVGGGVFVSENGRWRWTVEI